MLFLSLAFFINSAKTTFECGEKSYDEKTSNCGGPANHCWAVTGGALKGCYSSGCPDNIEHGLFNWDYTTYVCTWKSCEQITYYHHEEGRANPCGPYCVRDPNNTGTNIRLACLSECPLGFSNHSGYCVSSIAKSSHYHDPNLINLGSSNCEDRTPVLPSSARSRHMHLHTPHHSSIHSHSQLQFLSRSRSESPPLSYQYTYLHLHPQSQLHTQSQSQSRSLAAGDFEYPDGTSMPCHERVPVLRYSVPTCTTNSEANNNITCFPLSDREECVSECPPAHYSLNMSRVCELRPICRTRVPNATATSLLTCGMGCYEQNQACRGTIDPNDPCGKALSPRCFLDTHNMTSGSGGGSSGNCQSTCSAPEHYNGSIMTGRCELKACIFRMPLSSDIAPSGFPCGSSDCFLDRVPRAVPTATAAAAEETHVNNSNNNNNSDDNDDENNSSSSPVLHTRCWPGCTGVFDVPDPSTGTCESLQCSQRTPNVASPSAIPQAISSSSSLSKSLPMHHPLSHFSSHHSHSRISPNDGDSSPPPPDYVYMNITVSVVRVLFDRNGKAGSIVGLTVHGQSQLNTSSFGNESSADYGLTGSLGFVKRFVNVTEDNLMLRVQIYTQTEDPQWNGGFYIGEGYVDLGGEDYLSFVNTHQIDVPTVKPSCDAFVEGITCESQTVTLLITIECCTFQACEDRIASLTVAERNRCSSSRENSSLVCFYKSDEGTCVSACPAAFYTLRSDDVCTLNTDCATRTPVSNNNNNAGTPTDPCGDGCITVTVPGSETSCQKYIDPTDPCGRNLSPPCFLDVTKINNTITDTGTDTDTGTEANDTAAAATCVAQCTDSEIYKEDPLTGRCVIKSCGELNEEAGMALCNVNSSCVITESRSCGESCDNITTHKKSSGECVLKNCEELNEAGTEFCSVNSSCVITESRSCGEWCDNTTTHKKSSGECVLKNCEELNEAGIQFCIVNSSCVITESGMCVELCVNTNTHKLSSDGVCVLKDCGELDEAGIQFCIVNSSCVITESGMCVELCMNTNTHKLSSDGVCVLKDCGELNEAGTEFCHANNLCVVTESGRCGESCENATTHKKSSGGVCVLRDCGELNEAGIEFSWKCKEEDENNIQKKKPKIFPWWIIVIAVCSGLALVCGCVFAMVFVMKKKKKHGRKEKEEKRLGLGESEILMDSVTVTGDVFSNGGRVKEAEKYLTPLPILQNSTIAVPTSHGPRPTLHMNLDDVPLDEEVEIEDPSRPPLPLVVALEEFKKKMTVLSISQYSLSLTHSHSHLPSHTQHPALDDDYTVESDDDDNGKSDKVGGKGRGGEASYRLNKDKDGNDGSDDYSVDSDDVSSPDSDDVTSRGGGGDKESESDDSDSDSDSDTDKSNSDKSNEDSDSDDNKSKKASNHRDSDDDISEEVD